MSVLIVQVGQCGNQVGEALLTALSPSGTAGPSKSSKAGAASPYFTHSDGKARCVLIDSEPKVVEGVLHRSKGRIFRPENAVVGSSGRGNNWGAGYHGLAKRDLHQTGGGFDDSPQQKFKVNEKDQREQDDTLLIRALKAIHRETCRVEDNALESILVIHSLAGGTGSGFGCRLMQALREHFILAPEDMEPPSEEDDMMDDRDDRKKNADCKFGSDAEEEGSSPVRWSLGRSPSPKKVAPKHYDAHEDRRKKDSTSSYLMEEALSGEYGTGCKAMYLMSIAVAPNAAGETAVQGYNLALTLDALNPIVDGLLLLRNDFTKFKGFAEQNDFFARKLLLPVLRETGSIGDLLSNVCPEPPGTKGSNKIMTMLPLGLPQYAAFHGSCLRCRTYYTKSTAHALDTSKLMFDYITKGESQRRGIAARGQFSNYESHEVRKQQRRENGVDGRSEGGGHGVDGEIYEDDSFLNLPMSIRATEVTVKLPLSKASGPAGVSGDGVIVMNQTRELQRYLFPFLRDCALKLQAGAFLHQYERAGVSRQYLEGAVSNVVRGILETE